MRMNRLMFDSGTGVFIDPTERGVPTHISFTCGYCGRVVAGDVLAYYDKPGGAEYVAWLHCPHCLEGSVRSSDGFISPAALAGSDVEHLPGEVEADFEEARLCHTIGAYTAVELMCRKILMHVAVDKGADEGESFVFYVDYLEQKGYITAPMKGWVDVIRANGNEATHRIPAIPEDRAEDTLYFVTALLRNVYENPGRHAKYRPSTT